MSKRPLRVASFSGALGDYLGALTNAVRDESVDVVFGDYLAEMTMGRVTEGYVVSAHPEQQRNYYAEVFLRQLEPELAVIAERGIKVVVNAGAFNPQGMAQAIGEMLVRHGLSLKVAHVRGDDLMPRLPELAAAAEIRHLDSGEVLGEMVEHIVVANAYLGGWGIAEALAGGADIVICGRVTDASLVLGPAAWWHQWRRDDWDALAGAIAAGHIIECGPQAMGGNFSGFSALGLGKVPRLGFPIAEIAADGSSVITKRAEDGGAVTVDTVIAQLMYEIQGTRYRNPDVVLHVDSVQVSRQADDRVLLSGVKGSAPPDTTKIGMYYPNGYRTVRWAYITGVEYQQKADWLRLQMQTVVDALPLKDYRFDICGQPRPDPANQAEATMAIRIAAAAQDRATLQGFLTGFSSFGLGGFPGFHGDDGGVAARVDYWPGLIRQDQLQHQVVFDDGRVQDVALPPMHSFAGEPTVSLDPAPLRDLASFGPTRKAAFGEVVYARIGDKGANGNLGVWCRRPEHWPWLRAYLTTEKATALLALHDDVRVERYELPNVHGIELVLRDFFGTSGSGNIGLDQIGKGVGEFLRARLVDIPRALLEEVTG